MTPLYQELHRWAGLPFIWGESDCFLCVCDWIALVRGVDPGADLRGTYDSRGSCHRETGCRRDPVAAVDRLLRPCGVARTNDLHPGDVGVILMRETDGRTGPFAALWLGTAWAAKGPDGTTTVNPRAVLQVLAVWSVGYAA